MGNTTAKKTRSARRTVHPHGRGEYQIGTTENETTAGSPPRAWGILVLVLSLRYRMRFTPTGVGNTCLRRNSLRRHPVHPHGRGEYVGFVAPLLDNHGSPPRAWGIKLLRLPLPVSARFTPTGVGNTPWKPAKAPTTTVHPHGRGEYGIGGKFGILASGSPPRAWGILPDANSHFSRHRFTPTGVGNTCLSHSGLRHRAVHPHGRGEYAAPAFSQRRSGGSPPRAWGIHLPLCPILMRIRFTPTGVGNTGVEPFL